MAERVTRKLSDRLGEVRVAAHHGSLAKEKRLDAEQRLKSGALSAMVATSSLELGIDIGDIDLVCQLGSPRTIAGFLQRVGRSGHSVGGQPKGRLFPLSNDDLVECAALIDSVRRGELDRLIMPEAPLDVLAQQIAAEVNAQDWEEVELFALIRRAWPYRKLERETFTSVLRMLADGFTTRRGRRGALIHRDEVNGLLRGRRGARLTAITSGGTIPDNSDFQVLLEPESVVVGTVNEDFAVESLAGDIFQLGNTAYRIIRVERGVVRVEDAQVRHPRFRSGSAKRQRGATSCPSRCPASAPRKSIASMKTVRERPGWIVVEFVSIARRPNRSSIIRRSISFLGAPTLKTISSSGSSTRRRHAARDPFALRQPYQSGLGTRPS